MFGFRNEWLCATLRPKIYTEPLQIFVPSREKDKLGHAKQGDRITSLYLRSIAVWLFIRAMIHREEVVAHVRSLFS
jgi:hypothetical protein